MAGPSSANLATRIQAIEVLIVDVDGVLTDGSIIIDDHGVETKRYSVRDGSGFHLWRKAGNRAAILSGRRARNVEIRAAELGIAPVIQGEPAKLEPFRALLAEFGAAASQVCYIGDDLADLPPLREAGLAACPSDAVDEVKAIAHCVAQAPGGRGAVREIIEMILKGQGRWETLIASY